jgi:PAS domain S-box-containing protein
MPIPLSQGVYARRPILRYSTALVASVASLVLLTLPVIGRGMATVTLFAVLFSAWFGGVGPGLLVTTFICTLWGLHLLASEGPPALWQYVNVVMFFGLGTTLSFFVESRHKARRRAEESRSEAERHEQTFRQSEAQLNAILTNSPAVVYLKDAAGRYTFVNRRYETLHHVKYEEVSGRTDDQIFPAETAVALRANDQQVVRSGLAMEFEESVPIGDVMRVYLSVKFPLFDAAGNVASLCGMSTDITERKRAEEVRARQTVEAALRAEVSMALTEPSLSLEAMLHRCAEAMVRHLDAALARVWTLNEDEQVLVLRAAVGGGPRMDDWQDRVKVGDPGVGRIALERKPYMTNDLARDPSLGEEGVVWPTGMPAFAGYPLLVEDRLVGVTAVFARRALADQTVEFLASVADAMAQGLERKRLEEERDGLLAREQAARAEAESASRAKDQFLAVLSHELRTPLTPVLATVTAMLDSPPTSSEIRPTLEMIRRSVELEARLIDDLLDVTRVIHGKLHLDRGVVDVHALIHQTVGICRGDLQGKRMRLELALKAGRHHVDADSARLQQIFWNLIKNAVKFTADGGAVTIRTTNYPAESGGIVLAVEVADTGIGIEPQFLPRLFNAFEQGESSVARRFGGGGVGRWMRRGAAEAQGGSAASASASRSAAMSPRRTAASSGPRAGVSEEGRASLWSWSRSSRGRRDRRPFPCRPTRPGAERSASCWWRTTLLRSRSWRGSCSNAGTR